MLRTYELYSGNMVGTMLGKLSAVLLCDENETELRYVIKKMYDTGLDEVTVPLTERLRIRPVQKVGGRRYDIFTDAPEKDITYVAEDNHLEVLFDEFPHDSGLYECSITMKVSHGFWNRDLKTENRMCYFLMRNKCSMHLHILRRTGALKVRQRSAWSDFWDEFHKTFDC